MNIIQCLDYDIKELPIVFNQGQYQILSHRPFSRFDQWDTTQRNGPINVTG